MLIGPTHRGGRTELLAALFVAVLLTVPGVRSEEDAKVVQLGALTSDTPTERWPKSPSLRVRGALLGRASLVMFTTTGNTTAPSPEEDIIDDEDDHDEAATSTSVTAIIANTTVGNVTYQQWERNETTLVSLGSPALVRSYEVARDLLEYWTALSANHSAVILFYRTSWPFSNKARILGHAAARAFNGTRMLVVETNCTVPAFGSAHRRYSGAIGLMYNSTYSSRLYRPKTIENIALAFPHIPPARTDYDTLMSEAGAELRRAGHLGPTRVPADFVLMWACAVTVMVLIHRVWSEMAAWGRATTSFFRNLRRILTFGGSKNPPSSTPEGGLGTASLPAEGEGGVAEGVAGPQDNHEKND